jgi:hypothetical protein
MPPNRPTISNRGLCPQRIACFSGFLIGSLLAGLTKVPENERPKTIHILDTRHKVENAEEAIKSTVAEPDRTQLLSIVNRAGQLLVDRNLVLHAIIAHNTKSLDNPIHAPFRGNYVGREVSFSKETLEPIFNDVDNLNRDMSCFKHCAKKPLALMHKLVDSFPMQR